MGKEAVATKSAPSRRRASHCIVDEVNVTHQRLLPQAFKQVDAGDAVGKTRTVMAHGNPLRAALAGVDDDDPTAKPPEVGRGRQAGWAAADYETVARYVWWIGSSLPRGCARLEALESSARGMPRFGDCARH